MTVPVKVGDAKGAALKFVNAAAAVAAPVPPLAIGKVPLYEVAVTFPHVGALVPLEINTCPDVPAAE